MHFTTLVPNIFYPDINDGLILFVECLHFKISHKEMLSDKLFCVLKQGGITVNLFQDEVLADQHHPEFRLITTDIEKVYLEICGSHSHLLHHIQNKIELKSWGAQEFVITDNQISIIIQQW
ncbi:hypothetical protein [Chitinophaga rhizophila]|uniref:Uncharacterized protein n=1 Tax=Chitinophaga rhizophila TaxID=2866212 RepID=A0ABS7GKG7_9BACT|nr:hypothetical protein [Chitinophaga rhizophila]MBW8687239.1 hypothetical protein [Chitinophaga rhizophila]